MQIFICDDDKQHIDFFRKVFDKAVSGFSYDVELIAFENPVILKEELFRRREVLEPLPEILFLDIEMPELNGISMGKLLKEFFPEICLILLTAYSEFAIEGYETGAYRYLLKPVKQQDLIQIIADVTEREGRKKRINLKDGHMDVFLDLKDILYISAEDKYLIFHIEEKNYLDRNTLAYYEEQFRSFGFYRVHRKYLVNMRHHKSMQGYKIILSNGEVIPVSRQKKAEYYDSFIKMHEGGYLQ